MSSVKAMVEKRLKCWCAKVVEVSRLLAERRSRGGHVMSNGPCGGPIKSNSNSDEDLHPLRAHHSSVLSSTLAGVHRISLELATSDHHVVARLRLSPSATAAEHVPLATARASRPALRGQSIRRRLVNMKFEQGLHKEDRPT